MATATDASSIGRALLPVSSCVGELNIRAQMIGRGSRGWVSLCSDWAVDWISTSTI